MPVHRIPRAHLHEDLVDIQRRQCERIVSITHDKDDPGVYVVVTEHEGLELR